MLLCLLRGREVDEVLQSLRDLKSGRVSLALETVNPPNHTGLVWYCCKLTVREARGEGRCVLHLCAPPVVSRHYGSRVTCDFAL